MGIFRKKANFLKIIQIKRSPELTAVTLGQLLLMFLTCCFCLLRFYFRNWHGIIEGESPVWRYHPNKIRGQNQEKILEGAPLLDMGSLDYLFDQVCAFSSTTTIIHMTFLIYFSHCFDIDGLTVV